MLGLKIKGDNSIAFQFLGPFRVRFRVHFRALFALNSFQLGHTSFLKIPFRGHFWGRFWAIFNAIELRPWTAMKQTVSNEKR